jgi:hypothetical protein
MTSAELPYLHRRRRQDRRTPLARSRMRACFSSEHLAVMSLVGRERGCGRAVGQPGGAEPGGEGWRVNRFITP